MNKIEYLYELQKRLKNLPERDRDEIMEAFEEHFAEGKIAGKSDAEIMEELGSVEEVAESVGAAPQKEERTGTWRDYLNETLQFVKDTLHTVKEQGGFQFEWNIDPDDSFDPQENDITGLIEEEVQEVCIVSDGDLNIRLRKGDTLNYIFRGDAKIVGDSAENGKAIIRVSNVSRRSSVLLAEIPESVFVLDVRLPSGEVTAEDITPDTFEINTASADAELRSVEAKAFRFSSNSGDLNVRDTTFDKLFVRTVSGDIELNHVYADLDIRTVSGDIDLGGITADTVKLDSKSGDVDFSGETEVLEAGTVSGDADVRLRSHTEKIAVKTVSGDIDLNLADDDFRARLETVSGDLSDDTGLPVLSGGYGYREIGDGTAEIFCKTVSGDITLDVE